MVVVHDTVLCPSCGRQLTLPCAIYWLRRQAADPAELARARRPDKEEGSRSAGVF